jgi:CspA family cold shock protein
MAEKSRSRNKMKGKVKWFSNAKGYGFITLEDNTDLFVHYSQINTDGFKTLTENQLVEVESVGESARGKFAVGVTKIKSNIDVKAELEKDIDIKIEFEENESV